MTWLRVLSSSATRAIRPARIQTFRPIATRYQRTFSTTTTWRNEAKPDFSAFSAAFSKTALGKKIMESPDAQAAFVEFGQSLQKAGIDMASGQTPSTFQMMRLAANSDFRAATKKLGEELAKAGIDLQSPEVMSELMELKNAFQPQQKEGETK